MLELRHIIESGFLPLSSHCTANPDESLMIKAFEPTSGHVGDNRWPDLGRVIESLIGQLRSDMAKRSANFPQAPSEQGRRANSVPK